MGKKKNKHNSFYKDTLKPAVADNKLLLAALGGVAAGISIATILGTEKARQLASAAENAVKDFTQKITGTENEEEKESKAKRRANTVEKELA